MVCARWSGLVAVPIMVGLPSVSLLPHTQELREGAEGVIINRVLMNLFAEVNLLAGHVSSGRLSLLDYCSNFMQHLTLSGI